MRIEHYQFGSIAIEGKSYDRDLILFPHRIISNWWREKGHLLSLPDLAPVVEYRPDWLIVGTGAYGVLEVPKTLVDLLEGKGIEVKLEKTGAAVTLHNDVESRLKVVTALHLTC